MGNAEKRQMRGADAAGKARKLANAPETEERFGRILGELSESFAGIFEREPSEEEREALRCCAQISAAFAIMADDAEASAQE